MTVALHRILVSKAWKAKTYSEFGVKNSCQLLVIFLGYHLISMHFPQHHHMTSSSCMKEISTKVYKSSDRWRYRTDGLNVQTHPPHTKQRETIEEITYEYNGNCLGNMCYFFTCLD